MSRAAEDPSIFIRSMATRGSLGGLAKATLECVHVLDSAGFDIILLETVGVGQAEVDVVRSADTCVVVLVPGMGDSVQIIKAGLMEIADIFVINKADREGAYALEKDLYTLLSLVELPQEAWKPQVMQTVATTGSGVEKVVEAATAHVAWLDSSPQGYARRLKVVSQTIVALASEWIARDALHGTEQFVADLARECVARSKTPIEAVEALVRQRKV
jgi:LAO/AO transport system kinase